MSEKQRLSPAVEEAIASGRKIDAIKRLRTERGIDLKEAKDIIDVEMAAYHKANPGRGGDTGNRETSSGKLSTIVTIVVLAAILYYFFNKFT